MFFFYIPELDRMRCKRIWISKIYWQHGILCIQKEWIEL